MSRPLHILLPASVLAALAAASPAFAQGDAQRGKTFTTDSDVTRYQSTGRHTTEIFILRGTEAKESQKDPGIVLEAAPAEPPPAAPKARRGFRGRGTIYTE